MFEFEVPTVDSIQAIPRRRKKRRFVLVAVPDGDPFDVIGPMAVIPPPVPTGLTADPMRISRANVAGTTLDVSWNVGLCPSPDYHLVYGDLASVSGYVVSGSECALGTTGSAPGRSSSSSKPRPSAGGTCSSGKRDAVTSADGSRSGLSPPVRLTVQKSRQSKAWREQTGRSIPCRRRFANITGCNVGIARRV